MLNCINNETLKQGVQVLYDQNKITSTAKTDLDAYIDENTNQYFLKLGYNDFDQANSTGTVFVTASRNITNAGAAVLRTNKISSIDGFTLESFKPVLSTVAAIVYQISYDQNNWYTIDENGIEEVLNTTTGFYLKLSYSTPLTFSGLYIMYD
jgi:N-acetylneuraminic acid mutarotase